MHQLGNETNREKLKIKSKDDLLSRDSLMRLALQNYAPTVQLCVSFSASATSSLLRVCDNQSA